MDCMKLVFISGGAFLLSACASGVILGPDHPNKPGASFISVSLSDQERVFLRPLESEDKSKDYIRLQGQGIWVSGGWFMVEYFCDTPRNHPNRIVVDEDGEENSINIASGHAYSLQCDTDAPFVLRIFDQGELASQR